MIPSRSIGIALLVFSRVLPSPSASRLGPHIKARPPHRSIEVVNSADQAAKTPVGSGLRDAFV